MSKTIKIFTITFIIALGLLLGFYWLTKNKKVDQATGTMPWYQTFNPFSSNYNNKNNQDDDGSTINNQDVSENTEEKISKLHQITDFAVAGASFIEESRPIKNPSETSQIPEEKIINISPNDINGRKEIQNILNEKLSLNPKLKIDGVFGKTTTDAIKKLQGINNITQTGKIDEQTATFFTKKILIGELPEKPKFENAPAIKYIERTNGHIYRMFLDESTPDKVSNTTIPSIYEGFFDKTGKTIIYRYLSDGININTFVATQGYKSGEFLTPNITDLSVSRDKMKMFYLVEKEEKVVGVLKTFSGTNGVVVFDSPFTEWLSNWAGSQKIFLTTKPSYLSKGSTFVLDTTNKKTTKILGGIDGLTILPNNIGSTLIFNESTTSGPKLKVMNIDENQFSDLGLYGLPEKCVWSNDNVNIYCAIPNTIVNNQYPDVWYQGLISFDDYIIKINTQTQEKSTLINTIGEKPIDGVSLFLDKNENNLFFINKKDGTLWRLDLN